MRRPLTVAVPKGRVVKALLPFFKRAGIDTSPLEADDRRLVREAADGSVRFLLLKPDDVPTYVEYGTAELGISGRDVLHERAYDLYQPLDLGVGRCRMVVAGPRDAQIPSVPRIATKFPRIASEHFASRGTQAEIILVQGSVELAPLVGLSDLIVDLVESGATLRDNDLVEYETITDISSVVIANRSLFKLRHAEIQPLLDRLRKAVSDQAAERASAAP
ncbi:MAG TPA: ATP phosphoribosyltransferase [Polyangiaceae bacterium]|nr:ATP phosphoribosyltransferase [Polyangiaceae bacterium]